ncbi:MAG: outer membrane beta-barrel protein [Prevotella sp.]|nr:outer membrane beta-barrel protein [Prevotella sp.]
MKKQLLTALFILCTVCAKAQIIWTVKAGAGLSNFSEGPSIAWKAGLSVDIPLSDKFMFIPGVEAASKTAIIYRYLDLYDEELYFVQVPLQLGYKLRIGNAYDMNFKLGPYLAIPTNYGEFDYGIDAGIDFGYKHFVAGIDFQSGFANQYEDYNGDTYKTTALFITLGYRF